MIADGNNFMYMTNGDLFVFGDNGYGQLGLGHSIDVNEPVLLMNDCNITQIACSGLHVLIYKKNGDLFVCGCNSGGAIRSWRL